MAPVEDFNCAKLVELVTDYLDDALSVAERARFEEHLVICEGCVELSARDLCAALRRGDESAFSTVVSLYHAPLRRLALSYVRSAAVADEVVQETWLGVIRGIHAFEERSSLKTWIFRILTNTAKTRAERESRMVPLSALSAADPDSDEPSLDPNRFFHQQP